MSTARQRQKQTSSERGGQVAPGDVARKSAKGSPVESGRASSGGIQKAGNVIIYVGLLLSLLCIGLWCAYLLFQDMEAIHSKHGELSIQTQELVKSMDVALKQGQSLHLTIGHIEAMLKDTKQKQEQTDAAARHASMEVKRIDDILNKMQNEILKDLSDGIQDVKNSRERDVPFFEKSVEDKLTDLTASINDNIATFTKVQRTSQDEISAINKRVMFLEESNTLKDELEIIKNMVIEVQVSMTTNRNTIEILKNTVELVEASLSEEIQALVSLKQEQDVFNDALRTENSKLQALQDKVLKVEALSVHLSGDLERLNAVLHHLKEVIIDQENHLLSEKQAIHEIHKNTTNVFESRFEVTDGNIESLISLIDQQSQKLNSFLIGQDDLQRRLKVLDRLEQEASTAVSDSSSLTEQVSHCASSQEAIKNHVEELKQYIQTKDADFQTLQDEVKDMRIHQNKQISELQSNQAEIADGLERLHNTMMPKDVLDKLTTVQETVQGLTSLVDQIDKDLKRLSPTVQELVSDSGQIKENENNLVGIQGAVEELQRNFDKLLEKIELIRESI